MYRGKKNLTVGRIAKTWTGNERVISQSTRGFSIPARSDA